MGENEKRDSRKCPWVEPIPEVVRRALSLTGMPSEEKQSSIIFTEPLNAPSTSFRRDLTESSLQLYNLDTLIYFHLITEGSDRLIRED